MSDRVDRVVADLEHVTQSVVRAFASLSNDQLNWRPAAESWSIAQCLDHLITINRLYFPLLGSLRNGHRTPNFWERYSPLSGLLGNLLIKTLSPGYPRKAKTNPKAEPSTGVIDSGIVHHFAQHQAELIGLLRAIPSNINGKTTIITSPLLRWVTYSVNNCLTILAVHEQRHLQQAERVKGTVGFPSAA